MTHSKTALDHMAALYELFCNNASEDYILTRLHSILLERGLRYDNDGINEMVYYVDCFEYSLEPVDPAFCYEIRQLIKFMSVVIE
jgi:hypothetical protein